MAIVINNSNGGVVNICNTTETEVSNAKDRLLKKMYYARYKDTMGGYKVWLELLDMYYANDYKGMHKLIKSFNSKGGKTRNECLKCLEIIMKGGEQ